MDTIIDTFHLDVKLLVAQLINFIIVFVVLYALAVKPLTKLMYERTKKIEDGLKNAENFDEKLAELEKDRDEVILKAKKEAKKVLEESKKHSQEQKDSTVEKTKKEVQTIIAKAKSEVAEMKEQMVKDVRKESVELVVDVTAKIFGEVADAKVDKSLVKKYLDQVK